MTEQQLVTLGAASEAPLLDNYRFTLEWADEALVDDLLLRMRAAKRQTMNLRTGTNPRLLVCRHEETPVGWAGLDIETDPDFPELFSLYLYPEFRRYTIGLLLETARWRYLVENGVEVAYARMEAATNFKLLRYRLSTGVYSRCGVEDFPRSFIDRCSGCELYRNECTAQTYLAVDVPRALEGGEARIGEVTVDQLPREFVIRGDTIRRQTRPLSEDDRRQEYRPYWL